MSTNLITDWKEKIGAFNKEHKVKVFQAKTGYGSNWPCTTSRNLNQHKSVHIPCNPGSLKI